MASKDPLFDLIKSLTKSEKGYFKKYASINSAKKESNYLELFDAIDAQETSDKKQAKELFSEKKFSNHLHVTKNYLYHLILKSLRAYRSESSNTAVLKGLLSDIELLVEKGLHTHARKHLKKAKNLAESDKESGLYFDVAQAEIRLNMIEGYKNITDNGLDQIFDAIKNRLDELALINKYQKLFLQFNCLIRKEGFFINSEKKKQIEKLKKQLKIEPANSREAQIQFYYANLEAARVAGNLKKAYVHIQKILSLIESNPHTKRIRYSTYFILIMLEGMLGKYDLALLSLEKLRSLAQTVNLTENKKIIFFKESTNSELNIYIKTANFSAAEKLIPSIIEGLEKYKNKVGDLFHVVCYCSFIEVYFGSGNYKKALLWSNKILNEKNGSVREDILCCQRVVNLVIH